ncbi:MAG TPA: ATP-binding cassette domain-containing protein, partial [Aquificae bacterium]|nr:ATP-binding cassette domain-containing protein [Aquificota bacterium]
MSKSFGAKNKSKMTVLENINMEVNDGEWIGIVGESGSGKSTLAKIIMQ